MKRLFVYLVAVVIVSIPAVGDAEIVVDTDMGLDDVRAVFALLAAENEIVAFVTVAGSTLPGKGADNLIGLLENAGYDDAIVIIGEDEYNLKPPPWRNIASNLAGVKFPPPRRIRPAQGGLASLLREEVEHHGKFDYLALGPLSNLAAVEEKNPGFLEKMGRIWIPVRIDDGEGKVKSWNLSGDIKAAEKVLGSGAEIIIVDISSFKREETSRLLDDISGPSLAASWISTVRDSAVGHIGLFDELAAAAVLDRRLFEHGTSRYKAEIRCGEMIIDEDKNGNIKVAEVREAGSALDLLKGLWLSRKYKAALDSGGHHEVEIEPLEFMKAFHGHLGPWVVMGYRAGKAALKALGSNGHFGLSAVVTAPSSPPVSCFIDGVQLGSGCTLGKRNISAPVADGPPTAVFTTSNGGKVAILVLQPAMDMVTELVELHGVEKAGQIVWEKVPGELFRVDMLRK